MDPIVTGAIIGAAGSIGAAIVTALVGGFRIGRSSQGSVEQTVQTIADRSDYLSKIIEQVDSAEHSVLLCVHTLSPAEQGSDIERLQVALEKKVREGKDVRILAPANPDGSKASYQMHERGIRVRHLSSLATAYFSFSVFDCVHTVLPTKSGDAEETVEGITVTSSRLADLLTGYFEDMWKQYDAWDFPSFIRYIVDKELMQSTTVPLSAFQETLSIPHDELRRLFPAYDDDGMRVYLFLIGMPGSGKTTIAETCIRVLQRHGVPSEMIYYFNDYAALYNLFEQDTKRHTFLPADRGGFSVKDASVLDVVLQKANAELNLRSRSQRVFLVEFSRKSYIQAFSNFDREIVNNSLVINVVCSPETSQHRNDQRSRVSSDRRSGYVPAEIMSRWYDSNDIEDVKRLSNLKVAEIDTDSLSIDDLEKIVRTKIVKHVRLG